MKDREIASDTSDYSLDDGFIVDFYDTLASDTTMLDHNLGEDFLLRNVEFPLHNPASKSSDLRRNRTARATVRPVFGHCHQPFSKLMAKHLTPFLEVSIIHTCLLGSFCL